MNKSFLRKVTLSAATLGVAFAAAAAIAPAANAASVPAVQNTAAQVNSVPVSPTTPPTGPAAKVSPAPQGHSVGKGLHAFNATVSNNSSDYVAVLVGWDGVRGHENWQWLSSGSDLRMEQTAADSIDDAWVYFANDGKKFQFTMGPWINPSFMSFGTGVIVDGGTHWLEEQNSAATGIARGHEFTATRGADIPGPGKYSTPTAVMGLSFNS